MDGNRFDQITRAMASGNNRRGFLKGLTGALAGLIGLKASGADAACKPGGWYCQRNTDCCSGQCYASSRNAFYRVCTACTPTTCAALGKTCGTWPNGCGGTLNCPTCNDGNACTSNVCTNGVCSYPPVANGTACDDGNRCTRTDTCQAGVCAGSDPVICTDSISCHVAGVCDPATGDCSHPTAPNGTDCGTCRACRDGVCTPFSGPAPAGDCTTSQVCDNGACCTPKTCPADTCDSPFDPGCRLPLIDCASKCDDSNPCTDNYCNDGGCSNPPIAAGTGCGICKVCDGSGACVDTPCVQPPLCSANGGCNPATGACVYQPAAEGAACEDDLCKAGQTCLSGVCQGGSPKDCSIHDFGVCRTPACLSTDGCYGAPTNAGGSCATCKVCDANGFCTVHVADGTDPGGTCNAGTPGSTCCNGQCCSAGNCVNFICAV